MFYIAALVKNLLQSTYVRQRTIYSSAVPTVLYAQNVCSSLVNRANIICRSPSSYCFKSIDEEHLRILSKSSLFFILVTLSKVPNSMFEARLVQGKLFKQLIEALRDLVLDANIDCTDEELSIQAMDASHVSLVAVSLRCSGFDHYRCDRGISLGVNTANLAKVLKCMGNDDIITLKAEDTADSLTLMFETANQERISDFELKLMDIDSEQLGIPDTSYKTTVKMPSAEFQRIIRDLQVLGDTCKISITKEGIRFTAEGDLGTGTVLLRPNSSEKEEEKVQIAMEEPVDLTFALRYLNFFTKATSLGPSVIISMSPDVPIVVEYPISEFGFIKYYLAPKIDESNE